MTVAELGEHSRSWKTRRECFMLVEGFDKSFRLFETTDHVASSDRVEHCVRVYDVLSLVGSKPEFLLSNHRKELFAVVYLSSFSLHDWTLLICSYST